MKKRLIVFVALVILAIPAIGSAIPPRPGPYVVRFLGRVITGRHGCDLDPIRPRCKNLQ